MSSCVKPNDVYLDNFLNICILCPQTLFSHYCDLGRSYLDQNPNGMKAKTGSSAICPKTSIHVKWVLFSLPGLKNTKNKNKKLKMSVLKYFSIWDWEEETARVQIITKERCEDKGGGTFPVLTIQRHSFHFQVEF